MKKKKFLVGWARKNWNKVFRIPKNGEATIQIPSLLKNSFPIHKLNSKMKFTKVRITIEEF